MAKFSLITVFQQQGDLVSGNWSQNHVGTLATAIEAAQRTEAVNGHQIDVAVVDEMPSSVPILSYWTDRRRLDARRVP